MGCNKWDERRKGRLKANISFSDDPFGFELNK